MALGNEGGNLKVAQLQDNGMVRIGHNLKPKGEKFSGESMFVSVINNLRDGREQNSFGTISYEDAEEMAKHILRQCEEKRIADGDFSGILSPVQAKAAVDAGLKVVVAQKDIITGADELQWVVFKDSYGTWVMYSGNSKHRYTSGFNLYRDWKVWSGKFAEKLSDKTARERQSKDDRVEALNFLLKYPLVVIDMEPGTFSDDKDPDLSLVLESIKSVSKDFTFSKPEWCPTTSQRIDAPVVKERKPLTDGQALLAIMNGESVYAASEQDVPDADKSVYFLDQRTGEVMFRRGLEGVRLNSPILPGKRGPGSSRARDGGWLTVK